MELEAVLPIPLGQQRFNGPMVVHILLLAALSLAFVDLSLNGIMETLEIVME